MSDAAIRAAFPSDLDELTRLLAEMKRDHRERDPGSRRFEVPVETLERSLRVALRDPSVAFLVAERPGGLAGFVKLRFVEKSWGRACEVDSLMVEEEHRSFYERLGYEYLAARYGKEL